MTSEQYENTIELWKNNYYNDDTPIPGLEGYTATQLGWIKHNGAPITPHSQHGYGYYVRIRKGTEYKRYPVGYLVALAFLGEPKPGEVLVYLNGDCTDYNLSNLKWGTPRERYDNLYCTKVNIKRSITNRTAACKPIEAYVIGDNRIVIKYIYKSVRAALDDLNISRRELYRALKNDNCTCGGFHWRYKQLSLDRVEEINDAY